MHTCVHSECYFEYLRRRIREKGSVVVTNSAKQSEKKVAHPVYFDRKQRRVCSAVQYRRKRERSEPNQQHPTSDERPRLHIVGLFIVSWSVSSKQKRVCSVEEGSVVGDKDVGSEVFVQCTLRVYTQIESVHTPEGRRSIGSTIVGESPVL